MPTVAIASDFLDAFSRIPRSQQKKVREFTEKFKTDPTSVAINYEKIQAMKDPKVRTVRIDQKYRAIILHPDAGDVHVLVWVDNHNKAMAWAENRTFDINPVTGALQVLSVKEIEEVVPAKTNRGKYPRLLDAFEDELLLSFSVPAILLPSVRAIQKSEELQALSKHLPSEVTEALTWLAEGLPPDEIREMISALPQKEAIDPNDLAKALEHPDSRRRFVTIHTDEELSAMLDAPLEKWRIFLHPSQDRLVSKDYRGPAKVIGGAGTGKTVVAMHRARLLAQTLCAASTDRILFTTYTANLAQNIEENLTNLCGEWKERIEVVHLHAWAIRLMKKQGKEYKIPDDKELDRFWEDARLAADCVEFDIEFLKQEWEQVVQTHEIRTRDAYLRILRTGRGRTLTRPQRGKVWEIFENYRKALEVRGRHDWLSVIQETRHFIQRNRPVLPYRAVIVDEAQDFRAEEWRLIGAIAPSGSNGLFLVGDAQQRIYGSRVSLRQCGINIQGRSTELNINYRTTEEIRNWASALLYGIEVDDLDDQRLASPKYRSLLSGPKPEFHFCDTLQEEQKLIGRRVKELLKQHRPEEICIVARHKATLQEKYQPIFTKLDLESTLLEKQRRGKGIQLANMYRVKGLEFPVVILVGLNADVIPKYVAYGESDPVAKAEHENRERSLLFVAATRARDLLIATSWGEPSPFLPRE